jgi:hypothetical protein
MRILELSAAIAAEASCNPNVVFMIEFQEMLIEATYRKMVALLEADLNERDNDQPDGARDADDSEAAAGKTPGPISVWRQEAIEQAAATAPTAKRSRARKPVSG